MLESSLPEGVVHKDGDQSLRGDDLGSPARCGLGALVRKARSHLVRTKVLEIVTGRLLLTLELPRRADKRLIVIDYLGEHDVLRRKRISLDPHAETSRPEEVLGLRQEMAMARAAGRRYPLKTQMRVRAGTDYADIICRMLRGDNESGSCTLLGMLLAILATPPKRTSGRRTMRRVEMAAGLLGFETTSVVNLLNVPTDDVTDIATVGRQKRPWLASRDALRDAIQAADAVLLAWGASEPRGVAREHFREQVAWVEELISSRGIDAWTVGRSARHPSRWQRYTAAQCGSMSFEVALQAALTQRFAEPRGLVSSR